MNGNRRLAGAAGSAFAAALVLAAASGCATKGFVKSEVGQANQYTDAQVDAAKGELQGGVDEARRRADQAYDKATLAEQIASGALQFDEVSSHQVQFEFDDWTLDGAAQSELDRLGAQLSSYPRYVLEIRGYADATGSDRYNFRLGRERAESVQRYLMAQLSVPANRIAIASFGEEQPVGDNGSSEGRAENRRVQVRLLDVRPQQGKTLAASG